MPIHVSRKRGGIWYARGSVRVGKETVIVPEFSTGCRARADAEDVAAEEDRRRRSTLLEGPAGRTRRLTIADCLLAYLRRPGGVQPYDEDRIADFNERIGDQPLADAAAAWSEWLRTRGSHMAPATALRWRAVLVAALGYGAQAHGITAPRLPGVKQPAGERLVYLTEDETTRLLRAYNEWARPVATALAYQGLRTQEALRLDWRHVNWQRRTLHITASAERGQIKTKNRRSRTIPMHRRVRVVLYLLWRRQGRPQLGPVFLSSRGRPYADTRGQGGNPLRSAHATACRSAKITGFRVHDWRHSWAANMVMSGCDLPTLMRLGGWSTLRMVQRYVAVSTEHMAEAVKRLA